MNQINLWENWIKNNYLKQEWFTEDYSNYLKTYNCVKTNDYSLLEIYNCELIFSIRYQYFISYNWMKKQRLKSVNRSVQYTQFSSLSA